MDDNEKPFQTPSNTLEHTHTFITLFPSRRFDWLSPGLGLGRQIQLVFDLQRLVAADVLDTHCGGMFQHFVNFFPICNKLLNFSGFIFSILLGQRAKVMSLVFVVLSSQHSTA
jgi:hypothetical protein